MLIYSTSCSGKTSFQKFYSDQTKTHFIVFGRDETEFPDNYVPLLKIENINIESLANKTIILDNAGAFKQLRTKVEDLFRFGRHHNISCTLCKGCSANCETELFWVIYNNK